MITSCPNCTSSREFSTPTECYCQEDQGAGYTYRDEFGNCEVCSKNHPAICNSCNGVFEVEDLLLLENRICCDAIGYPTGDALFMDVAEWERDYNSSWVNYVSTRLKEIK